jgi:hypothetical protein
MTQAVSAFLDQVLPMRTFRRTTLRAACIGTGLKRDALLKESFANGFGDLVDQTVHIRSHGGCRR